MLSGIGKLLKSWLKGKVMMKWAGCIAMKAHGSGGKCGKEVWFPLDNAVAVEDSKVQTVHSLERRK